jgi:hypothetical protein
MEPLESSGHDSFRLVRANTGFNGIPDDRLKGFEVAELMQAASQDNHLPRRDSFDDLVKWDRRNLLMADSSN